MIDLTGTGLPTLGIFGLPGGGEWIILLILGLLLFGRRLPEVGRSIGKSIVEFKRGIRDVEEDINTESRKPSRLASDEAKGDLPAGGVSDPVQQAGGEAAPVSGLKEDQGNAGASTT